MNSGQPEKSTKWKSNLHFPAIPSSALRLKLECSMSSVLHNIQIIWDKPSLSNKMDFGFKTELPSKVGQKIQTKIAQSRTFNPSLTDQWFKTQGNNY